MSKRRSSARAEEGVEEVAEEVGGCIVLRDARICEYYRSNPHVNVESVNLVMIEMLESLSGRATTDMTNGVLKELVYTVKEMQASLSGRLHDSNHAFLENIRMIVGMATSDNTEKVISALQRSADGYVDQLKVHMPRTSGLEELLAVVRSELQMQLSSVTELTTQALETKVVSSLQPLYTFFSSTQEQLSVRLEGLKEEVGTGRMESTRMSSELGEFLSKYKSSTLKGSMGENRLEGVLSEIWPVAEIQNTTGQRACCDFRLVRGGEREDVLIETKAYERNVNSEEVRKFQRDCEEQRSSGIFLSQSSGISGKVNYQIEIRGRRVLVYVHTVDYDRSKIKLAVDVVDTLTERLSELIEEGSEGGSSPGGGGVIEFTIPQYILEEVGLEYKEQMKILEEMGAMLRESNKKAMDYLGRMKSMTACRNLLTSKLGDAYKQQGTIVCDLCNKFVAKNARALAGHKKGCTGKKEGE